MNYALLQTWVLDRVEDLVQFGVPRLEAECMMQAVECGAIQAEAKTRANAQFLLDFRRVGAVAMAERHGVSAQAIRKRRAKILRTNVPVAFAVTR